MDERQWESVEREFRLKDFWRLDPADFEVRDGEGVMFLEGCRDGVYHRLQGSPGQNWLRSMEDELTRLGRVAWLAGESNRPRSLSD